MRHNTWRDNAQSQLGGLPRATYASQCGVLQNAGVSRDAHAQAITKKNDPTFQGHNSSVREEDGQKNYGNAMDARDAILAKDEWELHSNFKATNATCHGNDQTYTKLRKEKNEGPIGEQ